MAEDGWWSRKMGRRHPSRGLLVVHSATLSLATASWSPCGGLARWLHLDAPKDIRLLVRQWVCLQAGNRSSASCCDCKLSPVDNKRPTGASSNDC
ncbi:hypothetical protein CALVIDRAFT_533382 [Calocera viscosa TUFC12733]|uniref:Uncharacterized protein n=1 Tax=Calocera viscosa (strain TUFC12733) TaxID=1330018 RepID=A0A167QY61_CALVF|nr:hypothetical protein CALVIDRAFT_533382 [Calocera viscosa TUFC12733]